MISFVNVVKRFGDTVAVDDVSCNFPAAQTHVLLGSSGCGKTTLLRLILGLSMPDKGWVRIDDQPMSDLTRDQFIARMGYLVQEGGLFPHLTAGANVELAAKSQNWPADRIAHRVDELADLVGLEKKQMDRYPAELSGGQKQRVGLMRALMLDPPILLLDEPLGKLDPLIRDDLQSQLKRLFEELRKTVVFVTHDIREAAILGTTITLMAEGRIVQHGSFEDLTQRPASDFVTDFLNAQELPPQIREMMRASLT